MKTFGTSVGSFLLFVAALYLAPASATFTTTYQTRILSEKRTGPADYHTVYGEIQNTVVTFSTIWLRTNDGKSVKIDAAPMTVDLQDLTKFGRGLLIDTRNVTFPGRASEIDVVEIEMLVTESQAYYNSVNGTQCTLKMPKYMNFYTQATTPTGYSMGHDEYLVKVEFSPLNAIQIDNVVRTSQKYECCSFLGRRPRCSPVGPPITSKFEMCTMANRRHPINRIVRKVDEF